jgi:hypothetical protein
MDKVHKPSYIDHSLLENYINAYDQHESVLAVRSIFSLNSSIFSTICNGDGEKMPADLP